MRIRREELSHDLFNELQESLELHDKEINFKDSPLDIDRSLYIMSDISGGYRGYIAREDEKIVGYLGYWIVPDMHKSKHMVAQQDVLYVVPKYRNSTTGLKLLKYSEQDLKGSVESILQQSTVYLDIGSLFKRMGYKEVSTVYRKEI